MPDEFIIAVTKKGYDVKTETDLNNYVFHSNYNTFKMIRSGIAIFTVSGSTNGQIFRTPHVLPFIPLVTAFAKQTGHDDQVFSPNSVNADARSDIQLASAGIGSTGLKFVSVASDDTDVIFEFDNSGTTTEVRIRYYCLEAI